MIVVYAIMVYYLDKVAYFYLEKVANDIEHFK